MVEQVDTAASKTADIKRRKSSTLFKSTTITIGVVSYEFIFLIILTSLGYFIAGAPLALFIFSIVIFLTFFFFTVKY